MPQDNSQALTLREVRGDDSSIAARIGYFSAGSFLSLYGLRRRDPAGVALALVGAGMLFKGATGNAPGQSALHAASAVSPKVETTHTITINRSAQELYEYWRHLENQPKFMPGVLSVKQLDDKHSHWVMRGPAGKRLEWIAQNTEDIAGRKLAWHSTEDASIVNWGSVEFKAAPANRGTEIKLIQGYQPPAGKLGQGIAKLLGSEPGMNQQEGLRRLKMIMEVGDIVKNGAEVRCNP